MARDSQAALVALNRFGFGARGGASGDLVNAALRSARFCQGRTEPPQRRTAGDAGIAVDPGLGGGRVRLSGGGQGRARGGGEGGRGSFRGQSGAAGGGCKAPRRSHSLNSVAMEMAGKRSGDEAAGKRQCRRDDGRDRGDAAERAKAAAAAAQRHSENLPRRGAGAVAARGASPIADLPSGWWRSGPTISASPPTRANWRGSGPARSSARRSARTCSGASATC